MLIERVENWGDVGLAPPATDEQLERAADLLGHPIPDELWLVLKESDGLVGEFGLGLLWNVERIVADNLAFRTNPDFASLYMPFDALTFFADAGNGDQFAIPNVGANPRDVFVWNHVDDSRSWVASSVIEYLDRWISGDLTI